MKGVGMAWLAAAVGIGLAAPAAGALEVTEFPITVEVSFPRDPAPAPDGAVWLVAMNSDKVLRFDPATKAFKAYGLSGGANPHGVLVDREGEVWITEMGGNRISRLSPATGKITHYDLATRRNGPHTPALDAQANLWFTMQRSGKIGKVDRQSGKVTEYPLPASGSGPYGLTVDRKGIVWFAELGAGKLGRLDPATGRITEHDPPTRGSGVRRVAVTPDGTVWFTQYNTGGLGKFDPATGKFAEYPGPSGADGGPYAIAVDGAGRVLYNEISANTVVRLDPQTQRSEVLKLPTRGTAIRKMATDAQGTVWYVGSSAKTIGFIK